MFDLSKDWTCTLEYKGGTGNVKVTLTPKSEGAAPTFSTTLNISSLQDPQGVQRGIVLDK